MFKIGTRLCSFLHLYEEILQRRLEQNNLFSNHEDLKVQNRIFNDLTICVIAL